MSGLTPLSSPVLLVYKIFIFSFIYLETRGACHYARPTGQRPVELTKGKCNDIVRKKQNLPFDRNFVYSLVKWDWKREFWLLLWVEEHRPRHQTGMYS